MKPLLGIVALLVAVSVARPADAQSITRAAIRRVIHQHIGELRGCHAEARAHAAPTALDVRVTLRFVIGPSGAVQSVTTGPSAAEQCFAKHVRGWLFPAPLGGGIVTVSYPFTFQSAAP